jgi:hypothetical protein
MPDFWVVVMAVVPNVTLCVMFPTAMITTVMTLGMFVAMAPTVSIVPVVAVTRLGSAETGQAQQGGECECESSLLFHNSPPR